MLSKYSHKSRAEASELILLDQFIQIYRQQFKDQTKMLFVDESVLEAQNVMVVVLVHPAIELRKELGWHVICP